MIIAAGSSSRLGQPKQLLMLQGEALLQRVIRIVREAGATPVFVVLGAHREGIEAAVDFSHACIVVNHEWEEGMGSSIRAGIQAVLKQPVETAGVLLMICDQPAVTAEHLGRMLDAFRLNPTVPVASMYAGKRGIPAIFPLAGSAELLTLRGDQGARGLLADPNRTVTEIPLERGDLDIDSPEDLVHLRRI